VGSGPFLCPERSHQCPGKIRTCAHGSGGQSCSPPTTCGNASSALRWGAYGCAPLTCSPVRATACGRVTMTGLNGVSSLIDLLWPPSPGRIKATPIAARGAGRRRSAERAPAPLGRFDDLLLVKTGARPTWCPGMTPPSTVRGGAWGTGAASRPSRLRTTMSAHRKYAAEESLDNPWDCRRHGRHKPVSSERGFAPPPGGCIRQPDHRQKLLMPGDADTATPPRPSPAARNER